MSASATQGGHKKLNSISWSPTTSGLETESGLFVQRTVRSMGVSPYVRPKELFSVHDSLLGFNETDHDYDLEIFQAYLPNCVLVL